MGSVHKQFSEGEVLTHSDVNDALNPTTADHLAYAEAAGTFQITYRGGTAATASVAFPAGRFTQPPIVVVTIQSAAGNTAQQIVRAYSASTTGFTVAVLKAAGGTLPTSGWAPISWVAIQMSA